MRFTEQPIQDAIIETMSYHGVCTAKTILSDVNAEKKTPITLQCLYKQLRNLSLQGIIVKHNGFYTFSIAWLRKMKSLTSRAQDKVLSADLYNNMYQRLRSGEKVFFYSKNQMEAMQKVDNMVFSIMFQMKKGEKACYYGYHSINPDRSQFNALVDMNKIEWNSYIFGNTDWDRTLTKKRNSQCVTHHHVKEDIEKANYLVLGDFLFEFIYCSHYKKSLHHAAKNSSLEDWSAMRNFIMRPESGEYVQISYNPQKAKHIEQKILHLEKR